MQAYVGNRRPKRVGCHDAEGRPDPFKLRVHRRKEHLRLSSHLDNLINLTIAEEDVAPPAKKPRVRSCKKRAMKYRDSDGNLQDLTPTMSHWYCLYVNDPVLDYPKFQSKFRRRFRMPFQSFQDILSMVKSSPDFKRWQSKDAVNQDSSPIELMVLGCLRYLGRGWTFDDIEEATGINEETHRQFFHCFITWGSTVLYNKYVTHPVTAEEAKKHMELYTMAGLNGCCASADGTHVGMEKCSHFLAQAHTAKKIPMPARSYNLAANHSWRILSTTNGHPAKFNDKTLQLFDVMMKGVQDGTKMSDVTFQLYEKDDSGATVKANYEGAWILVDNGYINWPTAIAPIKQPLSRDEVRWSEWVESMRKDVECTFGIMKGRFRLLKAGIRLHSIASCDKVWKTCCALHNLLLEVDGLEEGWEKGVSIWEGELGNHDTRDRFLHPAFAREAVMTPADFATYDATGMGHGNDVREDEDDDEEDTMVRSGKTFPKGDQQVRIVRELSHKYFQERLIEHFNIKHKKNELQWPKRSTTST